MNNKKENKKICIISPSLKIGGIERALTVLANYFAKIGLQVTFISCLSGERFYKLNPTIKLIETRVKRKKGNLNAFYFYVSLILYIRKEIKKTHPDIILVFGDWFSPLVLIANLFRKYPVYISDRTSPDYNFKSPIPILKKILYPRSAGFIAQTKRAADFKRLQFGDRLNIRVIPNAIREVSIFPKIKREPYILYVGRFAWEKGPERLINAFASIPDSNWKLIMAGSGPLLDKMKKLIRDLNIKDNVEFLGQVEDIDNLFAKSSIYVLPSVLEGFPNALCEAMAAGLPVICFDSIPYEEIIVPGFNGVVVKDNNINDLTTQLEFLMSNINERERLGNNAKLITERLNVTKIGNDILEFISMK